MENKCFECEIIEDLQQHHVVPKSRGGTKTVTLCHSCHMKAHGRDSKGLDHSRLTKEGQARARANGKVIGNPNLSEARKLANKSNLARGMETAQRVMPMIDLVRGMGIISMKGIARKLNEIGYPTPRGGKWRHGTVKKLIARMEGA